MALSTLARNAKVCSQNYAIIIASKFDHSIIPFDFKQFLVKFNVPI
jgi:hypothetical protein